MTTRFAHSGKKLYRVLIPLIVFAVIAAVFLYSASSVSKGSVSAQKDNLTEAINRTVTYCYAVEGAYPESLEYMKTHYGLTYNEELFYVDYRVTGSNIFPDITIIETGDK